MVQTTPPSGKQEKAGARPVDLDMSANLGNLQRDIERMKYANLETEKKSLKETITDEFSKLFKDKEAVTGLIGILGLVTVSELFGPKEDLEDKKESEEETTEEVKEMTSAGLVEKVDEKEMKEKELKDPEKGEVVGEYQTIAIQLKAAMNKRNTRQLKNLGITIPKGVRKLTAISMFRKGIGSYESFKETLIKRLQPGADLMQSVDTSVDKTRDYRLRTIRQHKIENVAQILSRCALGKFQILPIHYFKSMGWPHEGEEGLKAIYEFLRSPKKQKATARKSFINGGKNFIKIMKKKYGFKGKVKPDAYAMAAAHYGGPRSGEAILKARMTGKGAEYLEKAQTMGGATFGSIGHYARTVVKYYGKETIDLNNAEDVNKFMEAIGKKETGFLARKRAKAA